MEQIEQDFQYSINERYLYVPSELCELLQQAANISNSSPRASVVLSRCCLELTLERVGYGGNLAKKISQAFEETAPSKSLSCALRNSLDVIRFLGNIAAHPIYDGNPANLISIEEEEAEWCIEIIEKLFNEYYEQPEFTETRLMAYQGMLIASGRKRTLFPLFIPPYF